MLQDGHYVGQQQDDQGYQSSLSSPNESQMKRSGLVFLRISEVAQLKFAFQDTFKSKATFDCSEGGGPFQPEPAGIIARFSIFILSKKCWLGFIPFLGAVKHFGGDLSDSIRSNASTRSKVIVQWFLKTLSSKFWALYFQGCVWPSDI